MSTKPIVLGFTLFLLIVFMWFLSRVFWSEALTAAEEPTTTMETRTAPEPQEPTTVEEKPEEPTTAAEEQEEPTEDLVPCYTHGIDYITAEEYELLCRVVMSEASIEDIECQIAICETILNRLTMGGYGDSIYEVVHQPNAYSTADNGEPTESVEQAVQFALEVQSFPTNMVYFRTGHYHSFGAPYKKISRTYFSLKGE